MAEQPVFWLGGKPGNKDKGREPPVAESYETALREACEQCGFDVDEYVAAQGGFGGWLTHLDRDGVRYRLFWSGKANQLSFESYSERGGWKELHTEAAADYSLADFVAAVQRVLQQDPDATSSS